MKKGTKVTWTNSFGETETGRIIEILSDDRLPVKVRPDNRPDGVQSYRKRIALKLKSVTEIPE